MRRLGETVAALKIKPSSSTGTRLQRCPIDGPNPGNLTAWKYVPDVVAASPALVVVLHGCGQTAAAYDVGAGWSTMADRNGFVVLYPEQQRSNNPGLCFNWFGADDIRRGSGEAASIHSAIETAKKTHGVDPSRVFVTGLSAGGAMTSVMLASYPEVFAGGAIFAGLVHGSARSMPEAFDRMRGQGLPTGPVATDAVLTASDHVGSWPSVSIWQGMSDHTVVPANADALVAQWLGVHDLERATAEASEGPRYKRRQWLNAAGEPVVEDFRITGMGHGVPLSTGGTDACGAPGPYMLDVGIPSTRRLVTRWGLEQEQPSIQPAEPSIGAKGKAIRPSIVETQQCPERRSRAMDVQDIIENALRKAGLM